MDFFLQNVPFVLSRLRKLFFWMTITVAECTKQQQQNRQASHTRYRTPRPLCCADAARRKHQTRHGKRQASCDYWLFLNIVNPFYYSIKKSRFRNSIPNHWGKFYSLTKLILYFVRSDLLDKTCFGTLLLLLLLQDLAMIRATLLQSVWETGKQSAHLKSYATWLTSPLRKQ